MIYFIVFLGVLLIIAGIIMMIRPSILIDFMKKYHTSFLLQLFASLFRILIGIVMYMVASESRFPLTFEYVGILVIIVGVIILIIPPSKFGSFISRVIDLFSPYIRVASIFAVAIGAWMIYAVY